MVEQAYLVSLAELEEILTELTGDKIAYSIANIEKNSVTLRYNNGVDDLNSTEFVFPLVADLNILNKMLGITDRYTECLYACMHVWSYKQTRRGLYLNESEIKWDGIEDWEKFWTPLEALLFKRLSSQQVPFHQPPDQPGLPA